MSAQDITHGRDARSVPPFKASRKVRRGTFEHGRAKAANITTTGPGEPLPVLRHGMITLPSASLRVVDPKHWEELGCAASRGMIDLSRVVAPDPAVMALRSAWFGPGHDHWVRTWDVFSLYCIEQGSEDRRVEHLVLRVREDQELDLLAVLLRGGVVPAKFNSRSVLTYHPEGDRSLAQRRADTGVASHAGQSRDARPGAAAETDHGVGGALAQRLVRLDDHVRSRPGAPVSGLVMAVFPELAGLDTIPLPETAPRKWLGLREEGVTPPEFVAEVYARWLGRGLTRGHLRNLDLKLYTAIVNWLNAGNIWPEDVDLPTLKAANDRLVEKLTEPAAGGTGGARVLAVSPAEMRRVVSLVGRRSKAG